MDKVVKLIVGLMGAFVLLFAGPAAWAVYGERINLTGLQPPSAGTTAVFELADGQQVEGEVEQDGDRFFVALEWPGDGPAPGTLVLGGKPFTIPDRQPGQQVTVNLDSGQVEVGKKPWVPLSGSDNEKEWELQLEIFWALMNSDHLDRPLNNSAAEVVNVVLPPTGATNIGATTFIDDDDRSVGIGLVYQRMLGERWGWYTGVSYLEADGYGGSVAGTGIAPGDVDLLALSVADSSLEIFDWTAGLTYDFGPDQDWRISAGVGAAQVEVEDDFVTSFFANNMLLSSMEGSSSNREMATAFELILEYRISEMASVKFESRVLVDGIDDIRSNAIAAVVRF